MAGDEDDLPVALGAVIADRYRVDRVLGRGGMGLVLAGHHIELDERVAIKFLHREHASHADRFFREARAARRIRSEHVVRIYDVGRLPSNEPFIVMEYLEGEDLADRLDTKGALELGQAADILIDVCDALAHAHSLGIIHRDLKPANIYLAHDPSGDDQVKLLDFGVAKVPDADSLTKTATLLGSPLYMSPEQLMGARDIDTRSDIWSLGIILFELMTCAVPFEGDSIVHLGILVREKSTPSVRELRPDLPAAVDEVIGRCLAKDKRNRFANVAEFAEALLPFASSVASARLPRIRKVLAAGRESKPDLASTLPADSEPEESSKPSGGHARRSPKSNIDTGGDTLPASDPATFGLSSEPRTGSSSGVGAISVSTQASAGVAAPQQPRTTRLWLWLGAALLTLGLGVMLAQSLLVSPTVETNDPTLASSASTLPSNSPVLPVSALVPEREPPEAAPLPSLADSELAAPDAGAAKVTVAGKGQQRTTKPPKEPIPAPQVKPGVDCTNPWEVAPNAEGQMIKKRKRGC